MHIGSIEMPVVDVDTHIVEPPDLWSSHLPKKWQERAPIVRWDDDVNALMWFFEGKRIFPALVAAHAGWHECPPGHPPSWEDADPATYDSKARVARMDENGITVEVLYPNLAMFMSGSLQDAHNVELQNELIRAYNDWQFEWCSYAPERFAPMISVPFWDLEATQKEMARCADLGFKGLVFTQDPAAFGLPALGDSHWDPFWVAAEDRKLSINFHVGSGYKDDDRKDLIVRHTGKAGSANASAVNFLSTRAPLRISYSTASATDFLN